MEACFRQKMVLLVLVFLLQNLDYCWSLNDEGLAFLSFRMHVENDPYGALSNWKYDDSDPCSWFGVGCSEGKVVSLNLKNLCLEGKLAPELGKLSHIKSIILHNNSFSGIIPEEIGKLKMLELLDLGYNNLSGPLPLELSNILSLKTLLLTNNRFLGGMPPKLHDLSVQSEPRLENRMLDSATEEASCNRWSMARNIEHVEVDNTRRLLQVGLGVTPSSGRSQKNIDISETMPPSSFSLQNLPPTPSPSPSPLPSGSSPPLASSIFLPPETAPGPMNDLPNAAPVNPPIMVPAPAIVVPVPAPASAPPLLLGQSPSPLGSSPQPEGTDSHSRYSFPWTIFTSVTVAAAFLISISAIVIIFCQNSKVVTVRPWATGLSGQLQKAFTTGVPSLKRSELETACEDFSNIIGSSSESTVYKGILSSGVEIAVSSTAVTSAKEWSKHSEAQFRKKIATLSKVNHKNFVNLLGYCEEGEPFTRMLVFEYAPNGTLFEHLHIKEAERLDWAARLRIAMGMAYCLEYMHQLDPPVIHRHLDSTVVYLTDDYAAKIADFTSWDELLDTSLLDPASNVYSFGIILLEMMSGKLPYSENEGLLSEWASDYLRGDQLLRHMMDPTLKSIREEEASAVCQIIQSCVHPDPKQRPIMREVTSQLREITAMPPDGATPRASPLWWAELEILSCSDAS